MAEWRLLPSQLLPRHHLPTLLVSCIVIDAVFNAMPSMQQPQNWSNESGCCLIEMTYSVSIFFQVCNKFFLLSEVCWEILYYWFRSFEI